MSDDKKQETSEADASKDTTETAQNQNETGSTQGGPKFTESPNPLAGVKKNVSDVMNRMEGKTVSMKVYVGTIIGVVILMLLARCGG